jgi:putative membrane protein
VADNYDPRIYFAAERTLLAWIRTGLAVLGLGFVVARFGLFLRMIRQVSEPQRGLTTSVWIGVVLMIFGAAAMGLAGWQHVRFAQSLPADCKPKTHGIIWPVVLAVVLAFLGMILAGYLLHSSTQANGSG